MKILFVTSEFIIEPLGIMYLSSALKRAHHQVSIVKTVYKDYQRYALSSDIHHGREVVEYEEMLADSVKRIKPDIVAYSVTTGMHKYYLRINRAIKDKIKVFSVFGGPHLTFFPDMIYEDGVDAVCLGEGEEAFVEFVNKFSEGRDFSTVRNFWVKQGDSIYKNEIRPLVDDLDTLAFPDRLLIYNFESSYKNPIKNFIIGRGCPYDCTYCFNHAYHALYSGKGRRVRLRSPESVIAEIVSVKKTAPLEIVYFQDDIFVLSWEWLKEFLPVYVEKIGLPYHCHLRANLVNERLLKLLKDTGCLSVTLALESGNDEIRNDILMRSMSKDDIFKACSLLHRYGIKFRTENMIGLPGEDLNKALETLKMNIKCRPSIGWASLYQPYPKTELGIKCQKMGLYDGSLDSIRPSFFEESILLLKDKSKIENLQKLFSIIVEFPFLLPVGIFLIQLPFNRLYSEIYRSWKKYCYSRRLYNTKKINREGLPKRVKKYFHFIIKGFLSAIFGAAVYLDLFVVPRWFNRKKIMILGYHGVSAFSLRTGVKDFDYRHIPAEKFKKQIEYLKKHYAILPLAEIAKRIKTKKRLPDNTIAVTFDDGYADIYANAFDFMREKNVSSTVFLISSLVDSSDIPWFDKVELAFDAFDSDSFEKVKDSQKALDFEIITREDKIKSSVFIKEKMKSLEDEKRRIFQKALLESLNFQESGYDMEFYAHLGIEQIEDMKNANFEFGSHSASHPILTRIKEEELEKEVKGSKERLEEIVTKGVSSFSYPNGDYDERVRRAVERSGYLCAVTTNYGFNEKSSDLYCLKRLEITGAFSHEYFICSLFPTLRRLADRFLRKDSIK